MEDSEFMSAKEKELVLKQWRTFLKKLSDADLTQQIHADYGSFPTQLDKVFPDRLYKYLSCYCGFIAHYNRRGFLSARFGTLEDIRETFAQLEKAIPYPGFMDLNIAMRAELGAVRQALYNSAKLAG